MIFVDINSPIVDTHGMVGVFLLVCFGVHFNCSSVGHGKKRKNRAFKNVQTVLRNPSSVCFSDLGGFRREREKKNSQPTQVLNLLGIIMQIEYVVLKYK